MLSLPKPQTSHSILSSPQLSQLSQSALQTSQSQAPQTSPIPQASPSSMTRRRFLTALGLSGATLALPRGPFSFPAFADDASPSEGSPSPIPSIPTDPGRLVILSDPHIGRFPHYRFAVDWLKLCVSEIVFMNPRPAHVLIYGDLSFDRGEIGDYRMVRDIFQPLGEAGIPWTSCMGNHDRREQFCEIFPEKAAQSLVPNRLVFKVETQFADFIMLDSLDPDAVRGTVNDDQKDWLNETLKRQTKPTIVGAHHPLKETLVTDVLEANDCTAGYVNGHWHYWHTNDQATRIPNMVAPSSGLWGDIGLVHTRLSQNSATFTLAMRDCFPMGKVRSSDVPDREKKTAEKQGLQWRLDL